MKGRVRFNVLSDSELQNMKNRMEQILEERGIHLEHDELADELAKHGCIVDKAKQNVRFPKAVIDRAIAAVPEEFTLYSTSGKYDLKFPHPEGQFYTRLNTGAPKYLTADGVRKYASLEDCREFFELANKLDNIDYYALPSACAEKELGNSVDVYTLEVALNVGAKHIWIQPYESDNVKYLLDACAASVGGYDQLRERPPVSFISCSVPFLKFKHLDGEVLLRCARAGVPVQPCALPTAGANTPVTAQGTAFCACVDVLAQIVILELLCPGLPVIATPLLFSMDMMTTYTLQSNTEITIARSIAMELFEKGYNIRAHSYGTGTDSLVLDAQNFIERTSLVHSMALSEASVLGGAGQLETAKTNSPIQLIIDNEIFGIAKRLRLGLPMDEEAIDWDELIAGEDTDPSFSFLMSEHTIDHYNEPLRPDMFNRDGLIRWEKDGEKDLVEKAKEKFKKLKAEPNDYHLDAEHSAAVHKVAEEAYKALSVIDIKRN